jgi:hypothetical protein
MTTSIGFTTAKTKLLAEYNANQANGAAIPYVAKTKPYYSTGQLQWTVVSAGFTANQIAVAKLLVGQTIELFAYKLGDAIPFGPGGNTRPALEDDTNLSRPRQTNGVEDFAIEGISCTCRGLRQDYSAAAFTGTNTTDADILNALGGKAQLWDPAAIVAPPQMYSPFNLEMAMWEAAKKAISVELEWDRSRVEKLFRADALVEGGGVSYLRSSGEPTTDNRTRVPEGYLWRRDGLPDSEMIMRFVVRETVLFPINLVGPLGQTTNGQPNNIWMDFTARLHGLSLAYPSQN